MEFTIIGGAPDKQRVPCVVAGVFDKRKLAETAAQLDQASHHYIRRIIKRGDLDGRCGQTLMLHQIPGTAAERILLIGCGPKNELSDNKYREIVAKAVTTLNDAGVTEAASYLAEIPTPDRGLDWKVRQLVETAESTLYRFDRLKSKPDASAAVLRSLRVAIANPRDASAAKESLREGRAIAAGVRLAKDLANLPSNHCTPAYLADEARRLQKRYAALKVEVLGVAQIKRLRMGAFLAVARGSREPPAMIIVQYRGAPAAQAPVALVGKGITFDSGGISIKPAAAMDEMKYDMCGAASVLGTLRAVAELRLPINLVGLIPATENMPGGNAVKPGDIVTSLSGQTIEILNTDAEGRLVLCDTLTYARRFKPAVVIDIATLTGACVVALGQHASGLLSNHEPLAAALLAAGGRSGDRAWQLPLWEDYQKQLDSRFADFANVGGREAGSITAACFLARFAKDLKWAHLDIAGTAWRTGNKKGATGRPVPLLVQFLLDRVRKPEDHAPG